MHIKNRWKAWCHMASRGWKGLRVWKFENGIFRNCEGQSQPHGFPGHSTPCWRCDRYEQTAFAQVPEGRAVQKQPSLQPSCLTVSTFGQHESSNRTYGRTMYNSWSQKVKSQTSRLYCMSTVVSNQSFFMDRATTHIHILPLPLLTVSSSDKVYILY